MRIIEGTTDFCLEGKSAVAIGKFDGVHLGHRKLLGRIAEQKKDGLAATVFTFDTSAASFFGGEERELTTPAEKREIFEALGVDVLIEFPLNRETAAIAPEVFVRQYLAQRMRAAYICAGPDLSFGRGGAGDYALLVRCARECGYLAELIDKVAVDGETVSSTRVRAAVRAGDMEAAHRMLGVPYSVGGTVAHGRQLGRTIGMPTANLLPDGGKLLPPCGVYYSRTILDGQTYRSISNVGRKPTVSDGESVCVETYLYGFDGDLYGRKMRVELLSFRRPERKFDGLAQLRAQMEEDIAAGKEYRETALA